MAIVSLKQRWLADISIQAQCIAREEGTES
jgi:hypothetical protein